MGKGKGGGVPGVGGGDGGDENSPPPAAAAGAYSLSTTVDAVRLAAMHQHIPRQSTGGSSSKADTGGSEPRESAAVEEAGDGELGATETSGLDMLQQRSGTLTRKTNLGALLQRATSSAGDRGGHKVEEALQVEQQEEEEKKEEEKNEEDEGEEAQPVAQNRRLHLGESLWAAANAAEPPARSPMSSPREDDRGMPDFDGDDDDDGTPHRRLHESDHRREGVVDGKSDAGENADSSYIGDTFSAAQLRQQGGSVTVYIPRSPEPGVWAASVPYHGERDVAWVLAEALRMYEVEHRPVARHFGLARRPRLIRQSSTGWGPFQDAGSIKWEQAAALTLASPVFSVLRPGEELVVLVDGWQPEKTFARRPSLVAIPPPRAGCTPDSGLASDGCGGRAATSFPPSPSTQGRGGAPSPEEEGVFGGTRAPSDGARRFGGIDQAVDNGTYCTDLVEKDAAAAGAIETLGRRGRGGVAGGAVGHGGTTEDCEAFGDENDCGDGDDGDDVDTLTDEDDEECDVQRYTYSRPFLRQTSPPPVATAAGRSGEREGTAKDVSVTTRGIEDRCEDDGGTKGSGTPRSRQPGWAAGTGREHQQLQLRAGESFPEPRSPPRSLMSAMFSAWGDR